jgi:hypothetical protein
MKINLPKANQKLKFDFHSVKEVSMPFYSGLSEAEPIVLTPQEESKLIDRYESIVEDKYPVGTVVGDGDYPKKATPEKIEEFRIMRESIMEPIVTKDVRIKGGIYHGKHNINREYTNRLGKRKAEELVDDTYDYDVWVKAPYSRANAMQKKIDKKMKCDMAYAVKQPKPMDTKARWIVRSRANDDHPEVDYVSYPDPFIHPIRTYKQNGIEYETLESSVAREETLKYMPMRSVKARKSLYRYHKYKSLEKNGVIP